MNFTTKHLTPKAIAAAIERQRAIALHYANLDIQALNRQCLEERKTRYLSTDKPFKNP